ncbi:MAG: DUF4838 domain-containing protein [Candidatus Moduliflexus flocculans]|nr:DUF4838 domain-containing protein [Candidatus Moduliflexus flocculans]
MTRRSPVLLPGGDRRPDLRPRSRPRGRRPAGRRSTPSTRSSRTSSAAAGGLRRPAACPGGRPLASATSRSASGRRSSTGSPIGTSLSIEAWAARNKANGTRAGGDALRGGRQVYEGFVHTFYTLIPPGKYFDAHPEWFSEIDGRRTATNAQLCLTERGHAPGAGHRTSSERLRANPEATIASVSQNDCFGNCTCPKCRAVDEEEGGPAGSLLRFVNAVAADLEAEFPQVAFDTLAYQYTRKPPRLVRPRPSVIVRLCSIECSFARPLDDPKNKAFFDDLDGWSKIAGRLYIWDYTTDFSHYVQPHPNYGVLAPTSACSRAGTSAACSSRAPISPGARRWPSSGPGSWPSCSGTRGSTGTRCATDFLRGYYGPAAGSMDDFLETLEAAGRPVGGRPRAATLRRTPGSCPSGRCCGRSGSWTQPGGKPAAPPNTAVASPGPPCRSITWSSSAGTR